MPTTDCGFPDNPDLLASRGPTLTVQIGFDPQFRTGVASRPDVPGEELDALVDTGAVESCIDAVVARDLNLPIVDQRRVSGALGPGLVNVHLAQIYVPSLDITISGRFAGVYLAAGGQTHAALIGRSFLRHFSMTYDGRNGVVTLTM